MKMYSIIGTAAVVRCGGGAKHEIDDFRVEKTILSVYG